MYRLIVQGFINSLNTGSHKNIYVPINCANKKYFDFSVVYDFC